MDPSYIRKGRTRLAILFFLLAAALLLLRVGYVQLIKGPEYAQAALKRQYRDEIIKPPRGTIYDRTGKELAVSINTFDLWIDRKGLTDERLEKIYPLLDKVLHLPKEQVQEKLTRKTNVTLLARKLDTDQAKQIKDAKIKELYFEESTRRLYPYDRFLSYVLGHVSGSNIGLYGVEGSMDRYLRGVPGRKVSIREETAGQNLFYTPPVKGQNALLTVDEVLQHHMERVLQKVKDTYSAKRVTGILMDPRTGDIYAMGAKPDYNPNHPGQPEDPDFKQQMESAPTQEKKSQIINQMWRNPAVVDLYEPGSPFKVVTAAAGLEEKKVRPEEWFKDTGKLVIDKKVIGNWTSKAFGSLTFTTAVEQSVNTVFVQVGQRLGKEVFSRYIRDFGFGRKTGIDIPGEAVGQLFSPQTMKDIELATSSYGQGMSVTPIQMLNAVACIANDGKLMRPRLVRSITDDNGNVIESFEPRLLKRSISRQSSREMLSMMESVVVNGSGKAAAVPGYRIGAKTGTAQKVKNGTYQDGLVISSMAAVAPIEDPRLVLLVIVDEPHGPNIYGSAVAGPAVREILEESLRYLEVPRNASVEISSSANRQILPEIRNFPYREVKKILDRAGLSYYTENQQEIPDDAIIKDSYPKPGEEVFQSTKIMLSTGQEKIQPGIMPDLSGKTLREVEQIAQELKWSLSVSGSGKAVSQMPIAGEKIKPKQAVSVDFK